MNRKAEYHNRGEHPALVAETIAFGEAIMTAMDGVCQQCHDAGEPIHMEALLGAMVSIMAHHIAGIPDAAQRTLHFAKIGHELADMIATNVVLGSYSKSAFVVPILDEKEPLQ